jgi:DNA modification methylase
MYTKQAPLFILDEEKSIDTQEWGTFKDSLRAPIHNWFTYPAGFSYKAVESSLKSNHITEGMVIYDPFMGTGTTNVTAKRLGINSYGVEAHPFVYRVARTKLNWDVNKKDILKAVTTLEAHVRNQRKQFDQNIREHLQTEFPELILKCYEDKTLLDLLLIRNAILGAEFQPEMEDFFFVGLTSVLRQVSIAETGWPYVAPKKQKTTSLNKDALFEFSRQILRMVHDVETTKKEAGPNYQKTFHRVFNADSRYTQGLILNECIDHVFTSPPYLNNYDYADRTRLELYFWGNAKNWGEITQNIRTKLITSATTQISRDDPKYRLAPELQRVCPDTFEFLSEAVAKLGKIRLTKGGKKSYDHLVSGYFNDMFQIITDVFRVLRPGRKAVFVLGDSAPYGVHIPTDELIGKVGLNIGFSEYNIDILRTRGGKWKDNPQRHDVLLRESIVTLKKA